MLSRLIIMLLFVGLCIPPMFGQQQRIRVLDPVTRLTLPSVTETQDFTLTGLQTGTDYLVQLHGASTNAYRILALSGGKVLAGDNHHFLFRANKTTADFSVNRLSDSEVLPALRLTIADHSRLHRSQASTSAAGPTTKSSSLIMASRDNNAERLVEAIFKNESCFATSNHTFNGVYEYRDIINDTISQLGVFSNGSSSIGIDEGVILTNGRVSDIPKANTFHGTGYIVDLNQQTDPDLEALQPNVDYYDIAVLEFDFTPTSDEISFDYVFASDEYCSGPAFSTDARDVFAFVISGPGITGNLPSGGRNIAVLPDGVTPVNTLTVDNTNNTSLFVPNRPLTGIDVCGSTPPAALDFVEFDGFTVPLTARADVIPCETYHLKLIIADAGDQFYHSAVFFQRGSFAAGLIDVSEPGANAETQDMANAPIEGCSDGQLIFRRLDSDVSEPLTVYFNISPTSTATFGVDYTMPTDSFTIPAGQLSDTLNIEIFGDDLAEGTENIVIRVSGTCNCEAFTSEFFIVDPPPIEVDIMDPQTGCSGDVSELIPVVTGGIGDYIYTWSSGGVDSLESIVLSPGDTTFVLSVTDRCQQTVLDSVELSTPDIQGSLMGSYSICNGPSVNVPVILTGATSYTIDVLENGVLNTYTGGPDTIWLNYSDNTTVILQSVQADGCAGIAGGTAIVSRENFVVSAIQMNVDCPGNNSGSITLDVNGNAADYIYRWSDASLSGFDVSGLTAGVYSVQIEDAGGCTFDTSFTVTQPSPLDLTINPVNADCAGTTLAISPLVSGGSPPYSFAWSDGSTDSIYTSLRLPGDNNYRLTVTDACGLDAIDSVTVVSPDIRAAISGNFSLCQEPIANVPIVLSGGNDYTLAIEENGVSRTLTASGTDTLLLNYTSAVITTLISVSADGCPGDASGVAQVTDGSFNLTAQLTNISCRGDSSGAINIDVNGSPAAFTYRWSDPSLAGFQVDNLSAGTFAVEIVDAAGCSLDTNFTLTQPTDVLEIVLDSLRSQDCISDAFLAVNPRGGTAPYSLSWRDVPNAGLVRDNLVGGIDYILDLTDANGCIQTDTFSPVDNRTTINVSVAGDGDLLTCSQTSITYFALLNYPAPLEYEWRDVNNQTIGTADTLPVSDPGVYTLFVTDPANGCNDSATFTVDRDEDVLILAPDDEFNLTCAQSSIDLSVSPTNFSGNVDYEWFDENGQSLGTGAILPNVTQTGTYRVNGSRPDNGCSDDLLVTVGLDLDAPEITIPEPFSLNCQLDSVNLSVSATTLGSLGYNWSTANGSISGSTDQSTVTATTPGQYLVRVTDQQNGCFTESTVTVNQDLRTLSANAGVDQVLPCNDTGFTLTGSASPDLPGTQFAWQTVSGDLIANSANLRPSVSGTYVLKVIHPETGCPSTDEVTLSSEGPEQINYTLLPAPCAEIGASVQLGTVSGGTPPYRVSLDGGLATLTPGNQVDGLEEGAHVLTVSDQNGCSLTENFRVSTPRTFTGTAEDVLTRIGETVRLGYTTNRDPIIRSINWLSQTDLSCTDCPSPSVTPLESFTAEVLLLDSNGCSLRLRQLVVVDQRTQVYAPNAFRPNGPPGENERFTIFADTEIIPQVKYLRVFDRWGNQMWSREDFVPNQVNLGWDGTVKGELANTGTYIYHGLVERWDGTTQVIKGTVHLLR